MAELQSGQQAGADDDQVPEHSEVYESARRHVAWMRRTSYAEQQQTLAPRQGDLGPRRQPPESRQELKRTPIFGDQGKDGSPVVEPGLVPPVSWREESKEDEQKRTALDPELRRRIEEVVRAIVEARRDAVMTTVTAALGLLGAEGETRGDPRQDGPLRSSDNGASLDALALKDPSTWDKLLVVLGGAAIVSLTDYIAYNMVRDDAQTTSNGYRPMQIAVQGAAAKLIQDLAGTDALLGAAMFQWFFGADLMYYAWGCIPAHGEGSWEGRADVLKLVRSGRITWAGWTPLGLLKKLFGGDSSMTFGEAMFQGVTGLWLAVLLMDLWSSEDLLPGLSLHLRTDAELPVDQEKAATLISIVMKYPVLAELELSAGVSHVMTKNGDHMRAQIEGVLTPDDLWRLEAALGGEFHENQTEPDAREKPYNIALFQKFAAGLHDGGLTLRASTVIPLGTMGTLPTNAQHLGEGRLDAMYEGPGFMVSGMLGVSKKGPVGALGFGYDEDGVHLDGRLGYDPKQGAWGRAGLTLTDPLGRLTGRTQPRRR